MPKQSYYGDPYNQGDDFNWTTKFGKKPKTEGEKIDTGTYTEEGPIDTGELGPDGKPLMSKKDVDIESLTNLQKQRRLAQENKEFDDAVAGGGLDNLREGVNIKKKTARERIEDTYEPLTTGAEGYNRQRQLAIDSAAQKVREVTGSKTAGSIVGFLTDFGFPTAEDLALSGVVTALATPTGLGAPAAGGVTLAALRMKKFGNDAVDFFTKIPTIISHRNGGRLGALVDGQVIDRANLSKIFMDDQLARQSAQPMRMTGGGSGPTFRHSILNKTNRGLYKQLKNQDPKLIDQAENIIKELDLFKTTEGSSQQFTKWNPNRPTTGFRGTRTVPYINSSGVPSEVAFRWSVSNNTYVPYDLVRRQNTILKRLRWNVNRSPKAKWYSDKVYKIAKQDNAVLRQLLKELREENPQRYFDIMGDTRNYAANKGFIFVEHIHAQNSPYWEYVSKGQFKPRDTSNLMIVKNENFGKLKTSIEKHIYDNKNFVFPEGKRLILDYDKTRDVLVLKQLQDNGRLKRMGDISPITNPRMWKKAYDAALNGHTIQTGKVGEIQQVIQGDPDIDRNVDLQHGISDWNRPKE